MAQFRFTSLRAYGAAFLLAFSGLTLAQDEPAAPGASGQAAPGAAEEPLQLPPPPGFQDDQLPAPPGFDQSGGGQFGNGPDTFASQNNGLQAQLASQQQAGAQPQGQFAVQLVRAPTMLGDFFGNSGSQVTVGELCGEAVHQTIQSGSAFANNNISLITIDNATGNTVFVGGPAGLLPGSFFLPSIPPPLDDVVTGLTANGGETGPDADSFTAVLTPRTIDVFDNPADSGPSIADAPVFNIFKVDTLFLPVGNPGDLVGRARIQDNNKALPQDRIYFDYNFFNNASISANGVDVNRFVPGYEKTFWDGMASVELRMPMALTLSSDTTIDSGLDTSNYQFGNLMIAPKLLLWANEEEALAAGLGVVLPTASDINVFSATGSRLLQVENDSVHLVPYLAYLRAPRRSDYFVHAFLTLDVDTNGNPVRANATGDGLVAIGELNDQALISASGAIGKFIYRNNCRASRLKSLAWSTELHYTATVQDADVIRSGAFNLGSAGSDLSVLDATFGAHAQVEKSILTLGYTVPLTSDQVFDGEFRFFINRPF